MLKKPALFPLLMFIYNLILYSLSPFLVLRLFWKSLKQKAYRQDIKERFAYALSPGHRVDIWIHAVSLGETNAVAPLIETLLAKNFRILLTSTTPTGRQQGEKLFHDRVIFNYLPYDYKSVLNRFINHFKPQRIVIMETELWPNLITVASQKNIDLYLFNARLSEKSFSHYRYIRPLMSPLLKGFTHICAQTPDDKTRFIALGASQEKITVSGNMKFDLNITNIDFSKIDDLKLKIPKERPILILASTHEGEESLWLPYISQLQKAIPKLLVFIVPRHPERFKQVFELCKNANLIVAKRSNLPNMLDKHDVLLVDTVGELQALYSIAQFAFVGGSLVDIGGHNVLEPIVLGIPTLSGPYVTHFKYICEILIQENALFKGPIDRLVSEVINLYQDANLSTQRINAGYSVLKKNKGALERHLYFLNH